MKVKTPTVLSGFFNTFLFFIEFKESDFRIYSIFMPSKLRCHENK